MTTSATGRIASPIEFLRNMVRDSTSFRQWVSVPGKTATQGQASARIYFDKVPGPTNGKEYTSAELATLRPYCLLFREDAEAGFKVSEVGVGTFADEGRITARFVKDVPPNLEDVEQESYVQFTNDIGDILEDLLLLPQQAGYLVSRDFTAVGPVRGHPDGIPGDSYAMDLICNWS